MIVVMPDANNVLEAGWYANSPATGGWEDVVVRDLVAHVERRYRTGGRAEERALVGHSMGGFGALAIGIDRVRQRFSGWILPTVGAWIRQYANPGS
jgi:S-formylglutathione hydrolase FrmB